MFQMRNPQEVCQIGQLSKTAQSRSKEAGANRSRRCARQTQTTTRPAKVISALDQLIFGSIDGCYQWLLFARAELRSRGEKGQVLVHTKRHCEQARGATGESWKLRERRLSSCSCRWPSCRSRALSLRGRREGARGRSEGRSEEGRKTREMLLALLCARLRFQKRQAIRRKQTQQIFPQTPLTTPTSP